MSVTPAPAPTPVLPAAPSMTAEYVGGLIAVVVGLFTTQGLISNEVAKIITGAASVLVPLIIIGIQAYVKAQAHKANVQAQATLLAAAKIPF